MRSELLLLVAVAALFAYFFLSYVKKSGGEGDVSVYGYKASIQSDAKLHQKDDLGQTLLDLSSTPSEEYTEIWKRSPLHQEFIDLVPNFEEMRHFAKDRILGEEFQQKIIQRIDTVEDEYFSGNITQMEIEEKLDAL